MHRSLPLSHFTLPLVEHKQDIPRLLWWGDRVPRSSLLLKWEALGLRHWKKRGTQVAAKMQNMTHRFYDETIGVVMSTFGFLPFLFCAFTVFWKDNFFSSHFHILQVALVWFFFVTPRLLKSVDFVLFHIFSPLFEYFIEKDRGFEPLILAH